MIRAGSSPVSRPPRAEPLRFATMERSLRAVLVGTFLLRFSTGLTGSMLAFYLVHLPEHGGPTVDAVVVGLYAALFYLAELVLSPVFGVLSDRYGHHRVMLFGPIFGAVAVILTALTTNLVAARRDAAPRGRVGRRQRALDPRLHRARDRRQRGPPRQDRRAVRGRDAGGPRHRRHRRREALRARSASPRSSSTPRSTAWPSSSTSSACRTRPARPRRWPASTSGSAATSS